MQPIRLKWCVFLLTTILGFSIPAAATISVDGSSISAPGTGSLVTSAGTWTFGTTPTNGGYFVLLNGAEPAGSVAAIEMIVGNDGNLYTVNNQVPSPHWCEWDASTGAWIHLDANSPFPISAIGSS